MYKKIVYYVFKYFTLKLSNENCENALSYFFLFDSFLAYVFYLLNAIKGFLWGEMNKVPRQIRRDYKDNFNQEKLTSSHSIANR